MNKNLVGTIPQELWAFANKPQSLDISSPQTEVLRDSHGRIYSVCCYNYKRELTKQVFYNGAAIKSIEYYHKNALISKEEFNDSKLITKKHYDNGIVESITNFEYDSKKNVQKITKEENNFVVIVQYMYDTFNRIISRKTYNNKEFISKQEYNYDILDRVTYYNDENQTIKVNSYSSKNELINYTITDRMNNVIIVINHFSDKGYICTEYSLNEHSLTLNDTSYVDNIMLKRPYATEEDLDLIISNLYSLKNSFNGCSRQATAAGRNATELINNNISQRALPISIRKRVLYNIALKSK